jgi:type VI secretion system secreted protein VgrG
MARLMEISTPLGSDVLLFHGMHAREELSRLSEFQINLLSEKDSINVDDILGKAVGVALELPNGGTRYFNGYVTRFSAGGTVGRYHRYRAEVRPWLWFLSRTSDCRIFQEMTVPDIIKKVFADHKMADVSMELTGSYKTWTYCVQYRETDLNFVSRLMEEEGIYYYFRHTKGHDTLVVTDSLSKHEPFSGCEKLPFIAPEKAARPDVDHIVNWD